MARLRFLRTRGFATATALCATALVVALSIFLLRFQYQADGSRASDRTNRLERFGSQASRFTDAVPDGYWNTLELGVSDSSLGVAVGAEPTQEGSATWDMLNYEFAHLFASDPPCTMSLYVVGDDPVATGSPATADVFLNGRLAETLQVGGGPPIPGAVPYEHGVSTQPIFFGPLYQPSGHVIPVHWNACASQQWQMEIRVHHVRWKIARLGVIATFTPPRPAFDGSNRVLIVAGVLMAAALVAAILAFFLLVFRRYGLFAGSAALVIFLGATVTHDQWDFPVWARHIDLLIFGHGNPVVMTAGSPFWPYLTCAVAPIFVATYALFNDGSFEVSALLFKLTMALAYGFTAYAISGLAPALVRRMFFIIVLLSPLSLYGLAAGYRETFGALCAVGGLLLTMRGRNAFACVAFAAAGTITESLLPLTLLPAAGTLLGWRTGPRSVIRAVGYAVLALGIVAIPWLTFPHDQIGAALAFRTSSYRFGGASWYSVAQSYGMPLQFVRDHGMLVNTATYGLLSVVFLRAYVLLLRRDGMPEAERLRRLLYVFLGLEFGFYLCYTGVDPATWYALVAVTFTILTVTDPFNPYPIVLSSLCGLAFYSIAGLGDFMNWTYLWPLDVGLFGILGHPIFVFVGLSDLLILAGWFAAARADFGSAFGSRSLWFLATFAAACVAATIFQYPQDVLFVLAFAGLTAVAIFGTMRVLARRGETRGVKNLNYLATALALFGAYTLWAQGLPLWTAAIGVALALVTWNAKVGFTDVVTIAGTFWIVSTEPGVGWLSTAGYALLYVILIAALWKQHGRRIRRLLAWRPKLGIARITIQWESSKGLSLENNHVSPPAEAFERPIEAKLRN